ncbi:MAG: AMP-binding protein [Flavobacteriales bacterium Tduv]
MSSRHTDTFEKHTFNQVKDQVEKLAGGLQALGATKGDRIIIYIPMYTSGRFQHAFLRAYWTINILIFTCFDPDELAAHIDDSRVKVMITASSGI